MIPLIFAPKGTENIIKKVGGALEIKKHLNNLGFVPGGRVTILCENNGNLIVCVKDTRIAVSREMAGKIMI